MEEEEPLDFEKEDQLLKPTNKRRRVIGLDDLLSDYYEEKDKFVDKKSTDLPIPSSEGYQSDDDEKTQTKKEKMLLKFVDDCQEQVNKMNTEDEIPQWGLRIFGQQKSLPSSECKGVPDLQLLQLSSVGDTVFELNLEQGESFLEGLLVNRWLSKLAFVSGSVEDSVADWVLKKMLYSLNEEVQISGCEFWCNILLSKDEAEKPLVSLGWFPSYSKLIEALESYGYLLDVSTSYSAPLKVDNTDQFVGPPENISSWIKVTSACCQIRNHHSIFSTLEAVKLLCIIIHLLLDRKLQGLFFIINDCIQSIISYFKEEEWDSCCKEVAESVASRTPKDLNSLRIVECIPVTDDRSKQLRSQISLQLLILCFNKQVKRNGANSYATAQAKLQAQTGDHMHQRFEIELHIFCKAPLKEEIADGVYGNFHGFLGVRLFAGRKLSGYFCLLAELASSNFHLIESESIWYFYYVSCRHLHFIFMPWLTQPAEPTSFPRHQSR